MNLLVTVYLDLNLGDDLFIKCLKDRYKDTNIDIIAKQPELLRAFEYDESITPVSYKSAFRNIKKYDAFVIIGGSIFQDYGNKKKYLSYIRSNIIIKLFKLMNKPTFIMGCNIGPINTNTGKYIFKSIFKNASITSVRDNESYLLLKSLNNKNNYAVYPDIVFSMKDDIKVNKLGNNVLGISIINYGRDKYAQDDYINKIVDVCNKYISIDKTNMINLFGFDSGKENDEIIIDKIIEQINQTYKERINKVIYKGDINKFLESFKSCDFIIGTRFHSIILALKYKISFLPIVYSEKTMNLLDDIGFNLYKIEYKNIRNLNSDEVVSNIINKSYNYTVSSEYIKPSEGHFYGLDKIYSKKYLIHK